MSAADKASVLTDVKVNLYRQGDDIDSKPLSPFYKDVQTVDPLKVGRYLGELGVNFRAFAAAIDPEHPDVGNMFDGKIDTLGQLYQMGEFAETIKAQPLFATVFRSVTQQIKEEVKELHQRNPAAATTLVRVLKSEEMREKARLAKTIQNMDMSMFYRKGQAGWNELPDNFRPFVRHSTVSQEEIERVRTKRTNFTKLGLTSIAIESGRSIEAYEKLLADSFLGFRRLPMTAAAVTLAKAHNYIYDADHGFIRLDKKTINLWDYEIKKKNLRGEEDVYSKYRPGILPYNPRIYPFSTLSHLASDECKKMIAHLDKAPEAKGKPLFDHYIVLVPSFELQIRNNAFMNANGTTHTFKSAEETQKGFDEELVRNGNISPIILGERAGKCYFLTYFEAR